MKKESIIPRELVEQRIYLIRGQKVMLDFHLAKLYNIPNKRLKEQVRRNIKRFPEDFMFELTKDEYDRLRSQIATSKTGRGGMRYTPFAFTEQGVAMLSSVLNSERAIQVNIAIIRAFVKLRNILATHEELRKKLEDLERKFERHDEQIRLVFDAIRELMQPPEKPKRKIGFRVEEKRKRYRSK
jgi:phage regulator Rha-like protein